MEKNKNNLNKKKILFVASESAPFIRTGGLGDVAAALPLELSKLGNDVRVIIPLYQDIPQEYKEKMIYISQRYVALGWRSLYCGIFKYEKEGGGPTFYFLDNEYYFKRPGLYGYYDDAERFAFFSKAVIDILPLIDFSPDIIHSNDWQTGLVSVYLDAMYRDYEFYKNIKTVFTIHNIQFQGKYGKEVNYNIIGLPEHKHDLIEYDNCVNFMKGAIETSSKVTTVSPNYAKEIFDPYFSYGLTNILHERSYKISGITNGIDQEFFNPKNDNKIYFKYSVNNFKTEKLKNKNKFLEDNYLKKADANTMLIGMVTRLTEQKGIDILIQSIDDLMKQDIRLVILGQGDWILEQELKNMETRYGDKLRVIINFSTEMANKIYASSDAFLMPSKFEPCGLSQLISKSYGTVPIVREVGGLKDTVKAYNPSIKEGEGFTFYDYNSHELTRAVNRAYEVFKNKDEWNNIIKTIMTEDLSWKMSAKEYMKLYNSI